MFRQFKSQMFWNEFLRIYIIFALIGTIIDIVYAGILHPYNLGTPPLEMFVIWTIMTIVWEKWYRRLKYRKQE